MTRDERIHVQAIHDATEKMLAAKSYAETYMARLALQTALDDAREWATKAQRIEDAAWQR
jgi:hypothetical protein